MKDSYAREGDLPEGYPDPDKVEAVLAWVDGDADRAVLAREVEVAKPERHHRPTLLDALFELIEPDAPSVSDDGGDGDERTAEASGEAAGEGEPGSQGDDGPGSPGGAEGGEAEPSTVITSYDQVPMPPEALPPEGIDVDDEGPVLEQRVTDAEQALLDAAAAQLAAEAAAEAEELRQAELEAEVRRLTEREPEPFERSAFVPFVGAHCTYVIGSWLRVHARDNEWDWMPTTGDQVLALVVSVDAEAETVGLRLFPAGTELVPAINGVHLIPAPEDVTIDHAGCAFRGF